MRLTVAALNKFFEVLKGSSSKLSPLIVNSLEVFRQKSFRRNTNSSGDRMIAIKYLQSVRCAFLGVDDNQDPSRAELREAGNVLPRYGLCLSLTDKAFLLGFVLHADEN